MTAKRDDYRTRLAAYVASVAGQPFRPRKHDCALFAAGAVEAMTGVDHARGLRGYRTLEKGRAKLAEKGFADHVAYAASLYDEVPPLKARVGDVIARIKTWLAIAGAALVAFFAYGTMQRRAGQQDEKDKGNADTLERTQAGRDAVRDGRGADPDDRLRDNDDRW